MTTARCDELIMDCREQLAKLPAVDKTAEAYRNRLAFLRECRERAARREKEIADLRKLNN